MTFATRITFRSAANGVVASTITTVDGFVVNVSVVKAMAFVVVVFTVVVAIVVVLANGVVVGAVVVVVVVEVEEIKAVGTTLLMDCDSVIATIGVTVIMGSSSSPSSSSSSPLSAG